MSLLLLLAAAEATCRRAARSLRGRASIRCSVCSADAATPPTVRSLPPVDRNYSPHTGGASRVQVSLQFEDSNVLVVDSSYESSVPRLVRRGRSRRVRAAPATG